MYTCVLLASTTSYSYAATGTGVLEYAQAEQIDVMRTHCTVTTYDIMMHYYVYNMYVLSWILKFIFMDINLQIFVLTPKNI